MLLTINAKDFTRWLLALPPKRRIPRMHQTRALAVSRFLSRAASLSKDPSAIEGLAGRIWLLPRFLCYGEAASRDQCLQFLQDFEPHLGIDAFGEVVEFVKGLPTELPGSSRTAVSETSVEYRSANPPLGTPWAAYLPASIRRKWPGDDVSERICVAFDALKAAECSRPLAFMQEVVEQQGVLESGRRTIQHLQARLKAFGDRVPEIDQERSIWLDSYWLTRDVEKNSSKNCGSSAEFVGEMAG